MNDIEHVLLRQVHVNDERRLLQTCYILVMTSGVLCVVCAVVVDLAGDDIYTKSIFHVIKQPLSIHIIQ